jgi:hypothetical protein
MLEDVALESQGIASLTVAWVVLLRVAVTEVRSRGETTREVGFLVGNHRRRRRWRRRRSRKGTVLLALVAEEADAICRESD